MRELLDSPAITVHTLPDTYGLCCLCCSGRWHDMLSLTYCRPRWLAGLPSALRLPLKLLLQTFQLLWLLLAGLPRPDAILLQVCRMCVSTMPTPARHASRALLLYEHTLTWPRCVCIYVLCTVSQRLDFGPAFKLDNSESESESLTVSLAVPCCNLWPGRAPGQCCLQARQK